jgi:hypothetical protein
MPDGPGSPLVSRIRRRQNHRKRETFATAAEGSRPASARQIRDPLEPRVLLNADTLAVQSARVAHETQAHDVLMQRLTKQ